MRIEDFEFELPAEQIAQAPLPERDASRMMQVSRETGAFEHRTFRELPELLGEGDLLVVNDTRVIPARLLGKKAGSGGKVELLLVRPAAAQRTSEGLTARVSEWICLGQASKGLKPGTRVEGVDATITEALGGGEYRVRFDDVDRALREAGKLPLPPYIEREPTADDAARYQTVFAREPGSVAAPTAGLHFTPAVLDALQERGVQRASLTLEVGPGTFLPIRDGDIEGHKMHPERYVVPEATFAAVEQARRVIAVGTTVVRALESMEGPGPGETRIFIKPGYAFKRVQALLTNFHLPRSTLVMLVAAFLGREKTLAAYKEAVTRGYRFFSYGDCMWIG
jgi:S-adenosylmethionine:tRNA ribosyltransferase-isomerase